MKPSFGRIALAAVALASTGLTSVVLATEFDDGKPASESQPTASSSFEDEPSPYQQVLLADGHVTDTEMTAAVEATLGCLRDKGLDASIAAGKPGPGVNRSFHIVTKDEVSPKPALTDCKKQFMDQVEWRYASERDTRTPVSQSTIHRLFDECMALKGFSGAPQGTDSNEFWSTERLNEVAAQQSGDQAIRACFGELGHLKPE